MELNEAIAFAYLVGQLELTELWEMDAAECCALNAEPERGPYDLRRCAVEAERVSFWRDVDIVQASLDAARRATRHENDIRYTLARNTARLTFSVRPGISKGDVLAAHYALSNGEMFAPHR